MVEHKVRDLLLGRDLIECTELDGCFARKEEDVFRLLFGRGSTTEWVYHNVSELDDSILSWNIRTTDRFHQGENGYLLWLLLGSFALLAPLAEPAYCKSLLQGRDRVYLLSGFESLYSYLATVTPDGIRYETTKAVRQRAVWAVFNNSNARVASFEYSKKKEAEDYAAKLKAESKNNQTFFVQLVKEMV
jgi:hypothetical protein